MDLGVSAGCSFRESGPRAIKVTGHRERGPRAGAFAPQPVAPLNPPAEAGMPGQAQHLRFRGDDGLRNDVPPAIFWSDNQDVM